MKIYVASSWRNEQQPFVVEALRKVGHSVYDFKNPQKGDKGFSWKEIDEHWKTWNLLEFVEALESVPAITGFGLDSLAVKECDALVLLLPCGKSAHLEAGFAAGRGKPVFALIEKLEEPELMYKWFEGIYGSLANLIVGLYAYERSGLSTEAYKTSL